MQRSIFRWERDFRSQLFRLAIPIALQSVFSALMQIVDNLMIGRLGPVQIAAVTQADRITFLFQVANFGVVSGASIFVAQYWGERDLSGVRRTYGTAALMALVVATLLGIPSIFAPDLLMRLLLKSEAAGALGAQYLRVLGFVFFVQSQTMVRSAVLKSTEQVKLPMAAGIAAIAVNVLFSYLLIFDHGWIGGMGVRGGAIAMLIGAVLELFILEFFGRRYHTAIAARAKELLPGSLRFVKRFFLMVLPVLINESLWASGTVMYSAVYGRIGDGVAATAAAGIFSNVDQIASVAIRALCHACGVMVGIKLGASELDDARLYAKRFMIAAPLITQVLALLVVLPLTGPIVGLFDIDAQTARMAREMIYILVAFSWVHSVNCTVIVSLLRTGGDVHAAAVIDVLPLWLVGVPMATIAGIVLKWELKYVYLSTYVEQLAKTAMCIWRYKQGKWVRNIVSDPKN